MTYTDRTMYAEAVSIDTLARYRRNSGLTYRALADNVNAELRKIKNDYRRRRIAVDVKTDYTHQWLCRIFQGKDTTVSEPLGIAIERALDAPEGTLFVSKLVPGASSKVPA